MKIITKILFITFLFKLSPVIGDQFFCGENDRFDNSHSDAQWNWYRPNKISENEIQSVVIVVHGLNTKPEKMKGIIDLFTSRNFEALNVTLSGHGGSLLSLQTVTREIWLRDLYHGYCLAKERATKLHVPLYFFGFSLGGLIGIDLLSDTAYSGVFYDKIVLIAPALAVNNVSYLVKIFNIFTSKFIVPSASSKLYRANISGTSIAAYNALFKSLELIQQRSLKKSNVPTLVLVDPKDELVDSNKLQDLICEKKLTNWKLKLINNNESLLGNSYHHLMIDYESMGAKNWEMIKSQLFDFIVYY